MKVLLTGAAGFVGSHLTERLLADGATVIGVDNYCTGRKVNLDEFSKHPRFRMIEADVSKSWKELGLENEKLDWVMHFASPASPPKYFKLPIETMRVNSEGVYQGLELCKKTGAKFFYASTSEVYGDPLEHPQKESYWGNVNSIGVRSIYDEAKRFGEAMVYSYQREFQVDVRVIRIFNTYGPKMDPEDGRVVTNLMVQALKKQPMTLYGDGLQTRSFQYVSDLIEGIVRLMNTNYTQPVNLGNPDEFTILDFAKKVKSITATPSQFEYHPLPSDDPKQRKPDISIAKKVLDWSPKISLDQGLEKSLVYFKNS
jgi:nucleoside-diphosphate-sugar epimerase